ncbi:MAG: phosphatidate cytidylyltransferase [Vulcanimicrobiaceae bacterium]
MTATTANATRGTDGRRIASGLALAIVVLGSVATLPTFTAVVLAITIGSLWELSRMTAGKGEPLVFPVGAVAIGTYVVLAAFNLQHAYEKLVLAGTVFGSLAFALAGDRTRYIARSAYTLFGVLYIGWLGSYFLALRNLPHVGSTYTVAAIVVIAFTDIFAMIVGTTIGRTPLTSISPNKTWEGAIGGFLASVGIASAMSALPNLGISWTDGAIVGAITSLAAQCGDIVESALKRDARVKDAGTFLAGHGGILDRFDSYIFGGIAFYATLFVTGHIPH